MDAIPYSGQVGVEASILSPLAPVKQSGKLSWCPTGAAAIED